ncbi:hypothetical protein HYPSUDRAFT_35653 [Hypholoma sublateritium FD-334 SS-4]|uniref:Proteasome assembly chaperone 3 n=1 Tax=Hypholoma sublateritium (strain FD-334 SS-4) TaxID=945553 RepID=A0A0D2P7Y4_HYPSF|nr:hypothetical protein HYPSUDRAFT_35653 [Hypholoma sublateritium FD-334 SS-4]
MAAFTPRQARRELSGRETQVFMQSFADRILVLITQMGKVGNLIQATLPATASLLPPTSSASQSHIVLPEPSPAIELTPLLGSAPSSHLQILHSLYASQISTIIWTEESKHGLESLRRSVVVGLALAKSQTPEIDAAEEERSVFEGVMSLLYDLIRADV